MNFRERSVIFIATGCYSGFAPIAPGTFGSLTGLPICYLISQIHFVFAVLFIVIFILCAIGIANGAEKLLNQNDPGCIVIDEIAGLVVTLFYLPFNVFSVTTGFFIFRFFDIVKPFPIRLIEKRISGGAGVVLDDVLAGIYSNLVLRGLIFFIGQYEV